MLSQHGPTDHNNNVTQHANGSLTHTTTDYDLRHDDHRGTTSTTAASASQATRVEPTFTWAWTSASTLGIGIYIGVGISIGRQAVDRRLDILGVFWVHSGCILR
eukprot:8503246-Heterocapsa_arctica.AAC.1